MKSKTLSLINAAILALALSAYADEFDDFDSTPSASASESSYDGTTDSEFSDDEDYAAAYARYKNEQTSKAEINRQRTEGFARVIQLGARAHAGMNTFWGSKSEGWEFGFIGGLGLMVKMPLGIKNLSVAPELDFNYRHYKFEDDSEYGTDDATIDMMVFEIPLIVRYTFEDLGFFAGLGLNLSLKLTGSSEYTQSFNSGGEITDNNALVTSSVEVGGIFDLGFMVTRYINLDIRVVQSFSNILNKALVPPESRFQKANLLSFYTMAGITYLF
ncbi:MAG: PorT family protein [Fibrobacter sp.]|nr:PorT family protein [Fibrobacter sp.]